MFGIRLSFLRCQAGLTQAQLGARLSLTASALGMYEQGRRMPSVSTIATIAEEFGVSCDFLLSGSGQNDREIALEMMVIMISSLGQKSINPSPNERNRTSGHAIKRGMKQVGV